MDETEKIESGKQKTSKRHYLVYIVIFILASLAIVLNLLVFYDIWENDHPMDSFFAEGILFNQYPSQSIDEVLEGSRGRIPILEYHIIESPYVKSNYIKTGKVKKKKKTERYFVTSEEFRNQLETLYQENFRNISLDEYLSLMKGIKKDLNRLPPDAKLYVITFDDATFGQFDIIGTNASGKVVINPDCAVGMMVEFAKKHPDFKLNAAFSVVFDKPPFLQKEYIGKKLNMLLDYGFEIVNHTYSHKRLSRFLPGSPDKAAFELGRAMELFESYLGYRANTINKVCYPDGGANSDVWNFMKRVKYNGKEYHFIAGLNAFGMQAKNPNDMRFNPCNISRIEMDKSAFSDFVVNASGLYKTPALQEKMSYPNYSIYQNGGPITNSLEFINLK